ncbi:MAG: hypothetical protein LBI13_03960 [Streptococcaceae bacterium]|jgi:hypothetical protein|nr:hypothetical protein [Streptococcaceae bacterium]
MENTNILIKNPFQTEENQKNIKQLEKMARNGSEFHIDLYERLEKLQILVANVIEDLSHKQEAYKNTSLAINDLNQKIHSEETTLRKSKKELERFSLQVKDQKDDAADQVIQQALKLLIDGYQMKFKAANLSLQRYQREYIKRREQEKLEKPAFKEAEIFAKTEIERAEEALARLSNLSTLSSSPSNESGKSLNLSRKLEFKADDDNEEENLNPYAGIDENGFFGE